LKRHQPYFSLQPLFPPPTALFWKTRLPFRPQITTDGRRCFNREPLCQNVALRLDCPARKPNEIRVSRHETRRKHHDITVKRHETVRKPHEITVSRHETVRKPHEITVSRHETVRKRHEITVSRHETVRKHHDITVSRREIRVSSRKFPDFPGKTGIIPIPLCQMCATRRKSAMDTNYTNQHEFNWCKLV
jgi:hypothetical protein